VYYVRFEVFTAVTMKNGVFWDVTPCGSCKNRLTELGISSQRESVASYT
jgi:cytidine deaminase